ncbi:MAG: glycosyltransferase family 4 protein, partial [Candidatus Competibacteraceae bacterium]|nr:glycosyltransferase family 4 protein [Candidatus Competibacteraceae bacterium]
MRIGWLVQDLNPEIASVRYRCFIPATALQALGFENVIEDRASALFDRLDDLDCIVIVKFVPLDGLGLVVEAVERGIPVILDQCDHIFRERYAAHQGMRLQGAYCAAAQLAYALVTTGPALSAALAERLPQGLRIVEIPDAVETRPMVEDILARVSVKSEGILTPKAGSRPLEAVRLLAGRAYRFGVHLRRSPSDAKALFLRKLAGLARPIVRMKIVGQAYNFSVYFLQTPSGAAKVLARKLSRRYPFSRFLHQKQWLEEKTGGARREERAQQMDEVAEPPPPSQPPPPPPKKLLWFGNHGSPESEFGILTILRIAEDLVRLHQDVPIELTIVSNSFGKYQSSIKPLPFPTRYVKWDVLGIYDHIAQADVCIMPGSDDVFWRTKSANRVLLALSMGVPVVAAAMPSTTPLHGCIGIDDWYADLKSYLTDEDRRNRDLAASRVVLQSYSAAAIGRQWQALITEAVTELRRRPIELVLFIDLVQDLDLLLPVAKAARDDPGFEVRAVVTGRVACLSLRILRELRRERIPFRIVYHADAQAGREHVRPHQALITASESTADPHRFTHGLVKALNGRHVHTFTLQHGLENLGLTYLDPTLGEIRFGSKTIFTWAPPDRLPAFVDAETRSRCIGVGRTA